MYPRALGRMALDPALTCEGLPLTDPCWIAWTPTVVDTSGGGGGDLPMQVMPVVPLDSSGYAVQPLTNGVVHLGVTGTPGPAAAGLPWYLWAGILVGGVWALSKRRGGGGGSWQ